MTEPVVRADDLSVHYRSRDYRSRCLAIDGVSFEVAQGEVFGIVGESGSGKSTLAAALALQASGAGSASGRAELCGGELSVLGTRVRGISACARDRLQLSVGYLAQDGAERLDARLTVAENVADPIYSRDRRFSSREAGIAVATIIDAVRLPLGSLNRYPFELSSGQRQRVALARALILGPKLLVADEPTRGIDVTVRNSVLDIITELQAEQAFSAVMVSSDLAVVAHLTQRILVLNRGTVIGLGPINGVLADPIHPYLKSLAVARFDTVGA